MRSFFIFAFFTFFVLSKKKSGFAVSLHKGLLEFWPAPPTWETVLACFVVLYNLQDVSGCSIVTNFMPLMFSVLGAWVIFFYCLTNFFIFFSKMIYGIL